MKCHIYSNMLVFIWRKKYKRLFTVNWQSLSKSYDWFSFWTKAKAGWPSLSRVAFVFCLCHVCRGWRAQGRPRNKRGRGAADWSCTLQCLCMLRTADMLVLRQTHLWSKVIAEGGWSKNLPALATCLTCLPYRKPSCLATCSMCDQKQKDIKLQNVHEAMPLQT